jgi:hypothetical protein
MSANLLLSGTHITLGGVQCWDEGTEEDLTRERNYAKRTLVTLWEDRLQLVRAIRGEETVSLGGIDIFPAQPYDAGDIPFLYPDKFKIKGVGALSSSVAGRPLYRYARIEVTYSTLDAGELGLEIGSQVITLPKTGPTLKWSSDNEEVPYQDTTGRPMVVMTLTKSRVRQPSIPVAAIINAAKKPLNSVEFQGAEAGTVLFDGGRAVRYTYASATTSGGVLYDIQYRFLCRPSLPWNHLFRRTGASVDHEEVKFIGGDPYLETSDLNELFA